MDEQKNSLTGYKESSKEYYDANLTHYTELLGKYEDISTSVSAVSDILETKYILSSKVTRAKQKRIKST